MPLILLIAGIILLAMLAKYVVGPGLALIAHHLAVTIAGTVVSVILTILAARLFIAVLERHTVITHHSIPRPPRRRLPEPIEAEAGAVADRPFTMPPDPFITAQASALLACEGPGCSSFLPEEQSLRWRTGTATVPQQSSDDDFPEETQDIHEFCSEACMRRYHRENHHPVGS